MASAWSIIALLSVAYFRFAEASSSQFVCPSGDGQTFTDDGGTQYVLHCSSDSSSAGNLGTTSATAGATDCLTACDANTQCTGYTYSGGANGVGAGTCYLKKGYQTLRSGASGVITFLNPRTAIQPPYYGPQYTCPTHNNTLVTDQFGLQYIILCGSNTNYGNYQSISTAIGFDDCFSSCSNHSAYPTVQGPGGCDAFVYFGAANGVGSGACQLISGAAPIIQGGTSNQNTLVAAILFVSYSGPAPTATASSVTFPPASSAAGGASSVIGPVVTQIVTATATTIVPLLPAVTYTVTYTTSR
ncbi:hypothetical protein LTR78_009980 [Recurvomyces mirabilis]|uniref:Apple domain-containing protein n=1 Tax=Recurvomyces mirabilis TaxID=574656 RepID=A0AAE0WID9_9PEZI|nr:hypothetical protein LTR78_009980 [Recurvomyces mirabilis]KAK5160321.1 hypothetical protein LTS14_001333 [Recurvomyces mirabilis]